MVAPATPHDAKGLLKSAIRDQNPVLFIEAQLLYGTKGEVRDGEYTIPIGQAEVKRSGSEVTVVAYSKMLLLAMDAAEELSREGIDVEIIDPRTLWPLDVDTIVASVRKTGRVVIVEEGWRFCGLGAQIADSVYTAAFDYSGRPDHQGDRGGCAHALQPSIGRRSDSGSIQGDRGSQTGPRARIT